VEASQWLLVFPSLSNHSNFSNLSNFGNHFFTVKTFHNEIIDEYSAYWPVGIEHDGLRRQRETQDGKEGTDDANLRPELSASLSPELPSGLLP
jgi:hypothetical protein